MAKKTIKKTAAKKPVAKKTVVKKTPAKRVVAKPVAPVVETHECHCGGHCHCCCGCGNRFISFCIKLVVLCMVFLLGCIASPWLMRNGGHMNMMRHIQFDDNGCVVVSSIKCPKMLEALATADNDANGCITRAELRRVMKEMHRPHQMPAPMPGEPMAM